MIGLQASTAAREKLCIRGGLRDFQHAAANHGLQVKCCGQKQKSPSSLECSPFNASKAFYFNAAFELN